ncbi:OLC1v1009029C1 [Oldenlandia corymbosa var. corymbosa]|uniref:OLC1v1009029C1 n=1 Tax=Oldenlandia corymbosa var. corymbosa TaxID=529605 RepID=A0AAV1DQS7_OLDCO|nr:OLC1v1009029C1 [Oldenlandia corymbosa var. corymbosa]
MLGDDVALASFFGRIEDIVHRSVDQIHTPRPHLDSLLSANSPISLHRNVINLELEEEFQGFHGSILSAMGETFEWYFVLSDDKRKSRYLTADEILEILTSFLENLSLSPGKRWVLIGAEIDGKAMKALQEHVSFLKNIIHFVKQRNGYPREDFLAHIQAVALEVSLLLFQCEACEYGDVLNHQLLRHEIQMNISILIRKIEPNDPHVMSAYHESL